MKAQQIKTSCCRVKLRHDQIETLQRQIKVKTLYKGKCHGFMKFLPVFLGDYEIKYFTKQIT